MYSRVWNFSIYCPAILPMNIFTPLLSHQFPEWRPQLHIKGKKGSNKREHAMLAGSFLFINEAKDFSGSHSLQIIDDNLLVVFGTHGHLLSQEKEKSERVGISKRSWIANEVVTQTAGSVTLNNF